MKLRVYLPERILVDSDVGKVTAEAENGSFCLLPRHIDFVASLVPGIMSYERLDSGREEFLAVDEGILVKCGSDVTVSTRKAVRSDDLGKLKRTVEEEFVMIDDEERKARSIIARLETDFVRGTLKLGQ
ncbi:MAG: F0F1 ATP synthase subunit epsilon [Dehalococcoidia bacterium]|nr:F0F1 ATP synthase subunit epsilon [Dehalococcoidia bacterium]